MVEVHQGTDLPLGDGQAGRLGSTGRPCLQMTVLSVVRAGGAGAAESRELEVFPEKEVVKPEV